MPVIQYEQNKEQYLLKATFFIQKLQSLGFFKLFKEVTTIAEQHKAAYSWDQMNEWGIDEDAWEALIRTKLEPLMVFVHPNMLKVNPALLKYYRTVSLMPQKGLSTLSGFGNIKGVEENSKDIPETKLLKVVKTLNETISALIKLDEDIDKEKVKGMMFSTAGASIDGSWRNKIGEQGERVVRSLILRGLLNNNEVTGFVLKNGTSSIIEHSVWGKEDPVSHITEINSITSKTGCIVVFSSEPDVAISDSKGNTLGAIEIKAGLDPAGALERLGAMMKSFENTLAVYPKATTILVASCITPEVEQRLSHSSAVKKRFILTDVVSNKNGEGDKFLNIIRSLMGLV